MKSDMNYEVVLIDATETPIERPKKNKILLFRKEEKAYTKNSNSARQENTPSNMYRFS
ncbi:putative transposase [Orientia tsutsugamushi str. Gilliam]|uniref:Putative transposase n=1 Tax=Orientia tsutsugamushi str. Gilliam TaxID=1359184 RepID=A0A0F3MDM6_ORITS|nr:putative transposase [Orientia tsutsugamushi str. Gilliam]